MSKSVVPGDFSLFVTGTICI